ncbi:MAG TPA: class I SAM-dependent methyltransferase [Patescibacteria group bacterium]|nr:class I SAM-dependent methyltransferase [Patescibacteria group bacterium]
MHIGETTLEIMSKASWYNNWLMRQISGYLNGDILEVGAGMGNFTSKLSIYGKVTAIDYDATYKNANYGDIENGKYYFGKNKLFDTIVCMNVLEHINNDKKALENMFSLLNKDGKLILLVPAHQWAYGEMDKGLGHFRRYSRGEVVSKLQDSKFEILNSRYLNWLGLIGWFFNAKILRSEIIPEGQLGLFDKLARPFLLLEEFINPPFGLSVLAIGVKK